MPDQELLDKLALYCSGLIGEEAAVKSHPTEKKTRKEKKSKTKRKSKEKQEFLKCESPSQENIETDSQIFSNKILRDSDVSDEVHSDFKETDKSLNTELQPSPTINTTEDGFKIVSSIVSDDSDVSDAFESDLDESEWLNEVEDKHHNEQKINKPEVSNDLESEENKSTDCKLQNLKKPLRKLIEDFGLENNIFFKDDSKPCLKRSVSSKKSNESKKHSLTEGLTIIDYSTLRGKKKESTPKLEITPKNKSSAKEIAKAQAEAFKKAKHDVYNFALKNTSDKQKKQDSKIELAIKLGAHPPKKPAINYKQLVEDRKQQKKKESQKREEEKEMGLPVAKPPPEKKAKRDVNINPPIGKFRNGVLTLSKKEIESVSKKK